MLTIRTVIYVFPCAVCGNLVASMRVSRFNATNQNASYGMRHVYKSNSERDVIELLANKNRVYVLYDYKHNFTLRNLCSAQCQTIIDLTG